MHRRCPMGVLWEQIMWRGSGMHLYWDNLLLF